MVWVWRGCVRGLCAIDQSASEAELAPTPLVIGGRCCSVLMRLPPADLSKELKVEERRLEALEQRVGGRVAAVEERIERRVEAAERLLEEDVAAAEETAARMIRRFEMEARLGPWINWIPQGLRSILMPMP